MSAVQKPKPLTGCTTSVERGFVHNTDRIQPSSTLASDLASPQMQPRSHHCQVRGLEQA